MFRSSDHPQGAHNANSLQVENVLTSQLFVILMFVKCAICILCFTHSKW